jgi:hypothetical protein
VQVVDYIEFVANIRIARHHARNFNMGKPLVDLTKALSLASDLENEEVIRKHRRGR